MKKLFTVLLLLLSITSLFAQLNVGKSRSPINLYVSKHKQVVFDKIKTAKTIFVIPDKLDAEKVKSIINEVWTFNDLTFLQQDTYEEEPENYISTDNLIITLIDNGYTKSIRGGIMGAGERVVGTYIVFKFEVATFENIKKNKKGELKFDELNIAEIFFTPNIRLRQDINYGEGGKKKIGSFDKINEKYGEEPGYYNFNLGYIKNYFQELNRRLSNSENLNIEDEIVNKEKLQELKEKTLYAPDWLLKKYNALAATFGKTRTPDELFGKYEHKYELIDNEELSDKILNGDDFYYLMQTQFNQKKNVSVIHSLTGEIIYSSHEGSYNVKDSDLKSISKNIK